MKKVNYMNEVEKAVIVEQMKATFKEHPFSTYPDENISHTPLGTIIIWVLGEDFIIHTVRSELNRKVDTLKAHHKDKVYTVFDEEEETSYQVGYDSRIETKATFRNGNLEVVSGNHRHKAMSDNPDDARRKELMQLTILPNRGTDRDVYAAIRQQDHKDAQWIRNHTHESKMVPCGVPVLDSVSGVTTSVDYFYYFDSAQQGFVQEKKTDNWFHDNLNPLKAGLKALEAGVPFTFEGSNLQKQFKDLGLRSNLDKQGWFGALISYMIYLDVAATAVELKKLYSGDKGGLLWKPIVDMLTNKEKAPAIRKINQEIFREFRKSLLGK